jgi:hypothetical protein
MATLSYMGATQTAANDLVDEQYAQSLSALDLPQATVNSLLTTGFAPYVTQSYVNTQSALNATPAYVNAGDATRLHISQIGANSGIAGLNLNGRVDISRIALSSTQRFPKPFTSPSAYNAAAVSTSGSTEVQLYTVSVADPMFNGVANSPYKLLVNGLVDAATNTDGEYAIIRVRQGSSTGQLVATGAGLGELYIAGVPTQFSGAGTYVYTIPTWASVVDAIALGGGGGGGASFFITADGGSPGAWGTQTYTRGSSTSGTVFGPSTPTINASVGAGGTLGTTNFLAGSGGSSQVSASGLTTLTAGGGAGHGESSSASGGGPSTETYDGQVYVGGAVQNTAGTGGNAPGGGGASGASGGTNDGGPGADGAVWFFAKPALWTPSGPVNIIPTAFNAQTAITGATTLYVMMIRSGTASIQTASTFDPGLHVVPIPA